MDPTLRTGIAVSTVFAVGFLALVWRAARIARWVTGVGFVAASGVNAWTAWHRPYLYVEGFGPFAVRGYREFIYGPFAVHTTLIVLSIAVLQFLAGVLALKGSRLGPLGATIFLMAITPLGVGSGFPAPLLMAYGVWRLYRGASPRPAAAGERRRLQPEAGATSALEQGKSADLAARLGGLAFTVVCCVWASTAQLTAGWRLALIWLTPLLQFPIAYLGRRMLDANPTPRHARRVTIAVHYGMMTALGCALFPAFQDLLQMPTITAPVLRQVTWASVLLTGFATFVSVVTLAVRGLGAPFAVRLSGRLATDWMYAWTRNPMLLCTLAWFACLGIWHQSTWFLALLAVSVTPGWICFVRVYEERELELRFGRSYLEYRQRVPFLWPRVPGIAARGVVSAHPPPT